MYPIGWLRRQFHDQRKEQNKPANAKNQKGCRAVTTVFSGEIEVAAVTARSDFEKGLVERACAASRALLA
jgi:hypothetical protein